jgi:hypothetical protein
MAPLRQRMIQDMQLRGFSARTQECYVAAVRQLSEHYHTRPNQLTEEHLRHYFLDLANEKKVARATATIALCGIKFFYEQTLQRQWPTLRLIRPPRAFWRTHRSPVWLFPAPTRHGLAHSLAHNGGPVTRSSLHHPLAGDRRQPAHHPRQPGARQRAYHPDLHPSDV